MRYITNLLCEFPNPDITKDRMLSHGAIFPAVSNIFCHLCINQTNLAVRLCLLGFQLHYCNSFLLETDQYSFCFDFSYICLSQDIFANGLICNFIFLRSNESKAYPLVVEDEVIDVYCHMTMASTSNGECGDGGWTLIMKIDGNQVADLHYLWLPSVGQFLILNVSQFPFLCKITVSTLIIYKDKLIAETRLLSL